VNRDQFVHVIQAAAAVVDDELVVVGSQAVLASVPEPPEALVRSTELDIYPKTSPDRAIELDRNIGEGSLFHTTHGYYAHGVGPETITAPAGWEGRLVKFTTAPVRRSLAEAVGWCLSLEDLMLAKLAAARPHDIEFVEAALREGLVTADELERGVPMMPVSARIGVEARLAGLKSKIALTSRNG
jgi:hypothetical protein